MKKSGDRSQSSSGRRKTHDRQKKVTRKPDPSARGNVANPMESLAEKRERRSRRAAKKENSKKGLFGFLPQLGKKSQASAKVAPIPLSKPLTSKPLTSKLSAQKSPRSSAQVVEFPRKPQLSKQNRLEELRAKRLDRAPRKHALFSPPENPIHLPRPRNRLQSAVLYGFRLLILGVGLGVISGTVMSMWDPTTKLQTGANAASGSATPPPEEQQALIFGQELTPLKTQIQALLGQNSKLSPSVLLMDLDSHAYVDLGASEVIPAASTIKLPILIAFFQDVDQGKIQLDQLIAMRKDLVATEAGEMQFQPAGTKFSAIKTVTDMITVSDNTATNMLIDLLGGPDELNKRFQTWGLTSTMIRNALPDVQGTNTTSAKDMGMMLSQLSRGDLMSIKSRDRVLDIMRRVENNSLLPKGLGEGARIAHKTGTIGTLLGDVGLVDTGTGKRYIAAVLVKRPKEDDRAELLIQQISKLSYQAFNQQAATVTAPAIDKNSPKDPSLGRPKIAQP